MRRLISTTRIAHAHRVPASRHRNSGVETNGVQRAGPRLWLLDLDNTMHDASRDIMPWINQAMTQWVATQLELDTQAASELRVLFWRRYGATLLGLVKHHQIDAHDFLRATHPLQHLHQMVRPDHRLRQVLARLPGRRVVLTNAPLAYAHAVLRYLGVLRQVERVLPIESMIIGGRILPKPSREMYRKTLARLRCAPAHAVLVEDSIENLRHARHVGLHTVLVTGITHRHHHPAQRARAGRARVITHQIQSFARLPRTLAGRGRGTTESAH